jgi:hypothetical protein
LSIFRYTTFFLDIEILKLLPIASNLPTGENSPNLVALLAAFQTKEDVRVAGFQGHKLASQMKTDLTLKSCQRH